MKISLIPFWVKIAVPLAMLAAIVGGFWALDRDRDHWKSLAGSRGDKIVELQTTIRSMTTAQNTQHQVTEKTVTQVVQGPERIRTIVQHIHDAPEGPDCTTPDLEYLRNTI